MDVDDVAYVSGPSTLRVCLRVCGCVMKVDIYTAQHSKLQRWRPMMYKGGRQWEAGKLPDTEEGCSKHARRSRGVVGEGDQMADQGKD